MTKKAKVRVGEKRGTGTLGTFAGVFTPSVLTILGIILFRRLGYVVGSAGLGRALVIIGLANLISILTSFSLAAIATNFRVKGGGDYYLISRTLGVEFGGAIGIVLFLAQSVSIAFYCIGFGEVLQGLLPMGAEIPPRLIAASAVALLFVFAWLGTDWATKFQYLVMIALVGGIITFFIGGIGSWNPAQLAQGWSAPAGGPGFWAVFAIFFPAVTGFTQGVSMSGDLKNPGKSLPLGTFAAVGISMVVYFGAAALFAAGMDAESLRGDYDAMKRLSSAGWAIDTGVIAATLSSAMASFLGAPRILQALAADRVFPFLTPLAKGAGPTGNPRRGVLVSAAIAFATVALGSLNVVAPIVAMFFLASYGLLNYATYYEASASSPAFRPRFRWFSARASLAGALGCLVAMVAINPTAGVISVSLLFGIYQYLKRTAGPARWADGNRSYRFQRIRENLIEMKPELEHPRDWRPQILAFSKDPERREKLLRFASWIEGGSGLTTAVQIVDGEGSASCEHKNEAQDRLRTDIAKKGLKAFPLVVQAPDLKCGFEILVQSYGVGPLRANIVLMNWLDKNVYTDDPSAEREYGHYLKETLKLGCHLVVFDADDKEWGALEAQPAGERRIDVWWWENKTSRLALLLAYLMTRTDAWEGSTIRVLAPKGGKVKSLEALQRTLEDARIDAEPVLVDAAEGDGIVEASADASLVFLPIRIRGGRPVDPLGEDPEALIARLPSVAMVTAAEDIELDAEPDEGKPAEIAEAVEEADVAEKEAKKAEKEAAKVAAAAEAAEKKLEAMKEEPATKSEVDPQKKSVEKKTRKLKVGAEKAEEEATRARRKAEQAARKTEDLGVIREETEEKKEETE